MPFKAVIFDFNGTLFQDTKYHLEAWRQYSTKLRGYPFTDEEMIHHMLGKTNELIIEYCINKKPDKDFSIRCGAEKEALYREILLKTSESINLTNGAVKFLDYLKSNNTPINIATGSEKTNLDFYIKTFNLEKWFNISKIVYDDGNIKGKPNPDIYLNAAKNINVAPENCIVFEDALSGINAALSAGIGKIYAIKDRENRFEFESEKVSFIDDFTQLDFNSLLN